MEAGELGSKTMIVFLPRFVAAGNAMVAAIVPGSAKSFVFDRDFHLTEKEVSEILHTSRN